MLRNVKNPYVCSECGKELFRDRESYKKRYWEQLHKKSETDRCRKMIVRKSHEKARALLKEKASSEKSSIYIFLMSR